VGQHVPAQSYRIEDSQVASANLFASLYLTYLRADNLKTPKGGLDTQAVMDENSIWQKQHLRVGRSEHSTQAGATASPSLRPGNLRHELKFGFGYRRVSETRRRCGLPTSSSGMSLPPRRDHPRG
jgi:hypothetical protein